MDRREPPRAAIGVGAAQRPGRTIRPSASTWPAACPKSCCDLRELNLLDLDAATITGQSLGEALAWWETSPRRQAVRRWLQQSVGVDPDEVIMTPQRAAELGVTSTMCFPRGNLAPQGSVIKSTAIDPAVRRRRRRLSA